MHDNVALTTASRTLLLFYFHVRGIAVGLLLQKIEVKMKPDSVLIRLEKKAFRG